MEQPPPVPVTQPRVQNFAQSEGMRLAGWFGSEEVMSWSASDMLAVYERLSVLRMRLVPI